MNHFDKQGNYINEENLSLREIYEQGFSEGVRRSRMPVIMKAKHITYEEKQKIIEEWKRTTALGLVIVRDDFEIVAPKMTRFPIKYRDMTEEEIKDMCEQYDIDNPDKERDC